MVGNISVNGQSILWTYLRIQTSYSVVIFGEAIMPLAGGGSISTCMLEGSITPLGVTLNQTQLQLQCRHGSLARRPVEEI